VGVLLFSSRRRHTRSKRDWSSDVCSSDLPADVVVYGDIHHAYVRAEHDGTLVNVGSVGNPLDEPVPSYAILEGDPDGEAGSPFEIGRASCRGRGGGAGEAVC